MLYKVCNSSFWLKVLVWYSLLATCESYKPPTCMHVMHDTSMKTILHLHKSTSAPNTVHHTYSTGKAPVVGQGRPAKRQVCALG